MTEAGEKLYGEWEKPGEREGLFSSRRFWVGFLTMMLALMLLAIALFGFG